MCILRFKNLFCFFFCFFFCSSFRSGLDHSDRPLSWCDSPTTYSTRQASFPSQAGQREYLIKHRLGKKESEYVDIQGFRWDNLCTWFTLSVKKQLKYATKAPIIIIVVVLQVFRWNVECEWSVPWQQPGAVAQLWGRASWCLCYWVRTTRLCNISSFVFSWLLQRINIYFLDFRSWTWALKHSSTWTHPKSRSGLRLWRGVYIPKRNIRGWAAKVAPWMIFDLVKRREIYRWCLVFVRLGSDHPTCGDDARRLCQ